MLSLAVRRRRRHSIPKRIKRNTKESRRISQPMARTLLTEERNQLVTSPIQPRRHHHDIRSISVHHTKGPVPNLAIQHHLSARQRAFSQLGNLLRALLRPPHRNRQHPGRSPPKDSNPAPYDFHKISISFAFRPRPYSSLEYLLRINLFRN